MCASSNVPTTLRLISTWPLGRHIRPRRGHPDASYVVLSLYLGCVSDASVSPIEVSSFRHSMNSNLCSTMLQRSASFDEIACHR